MTMLFNRPSEVLLLYFLTFFALSCRQDTRQLFLQCSCWASALEVTDATISADLFLVLLLLCSGCTVDWLHHLPGYVHLCFAPFFAASDGRLWMTLASFGFVWDWVIFIVLWLCVSEWVAGVCECEHFADVWTSLSWFTSGPYICFRKHTCKQVHSVKCASACTCALFHVPRHPPIVLGKTHREHRWLVCRGSWAG